MYEDLGLFVDGVWLRGGGRDTRPVYDPATEEVLGVLPLATEQDLGVALSAASRAFETWRTTSPSERAAILKRAASNLRMRSVEVAENLVKEQGKIKREAEIEVSVSSEIIEWSAEEGRRQYGRIIPPRSSEYRQSVIHEPVGVSVLITSWNVPVLFAARKFSECLAAGCTAIMIGSESAPASAIAVMRALEEAGLPPGVANLVFGASPDTSRFLLSAPVVRKVSFTGGTAGGKAIMRLAADSVLTSTMELGGHAPAIVFDDVDTDKVATILVASKYRNAGQVCNSPTRFFVHEAVYSDFVRSFVAQAKAIQVGSGLERGVQMGPLSNKRRLSAIVEIVADAVGKGARLSAGGGRIGNRGYFYQPTVLEEIPAEARILHEEPFGPVAAMLPFSDTDQMIADANSLPYGLAAYAYTNSLRNVSAVEVGLRVGMLGVNTPQISLPETPFGGSKESGFGSEGGSEGVASYMTTKYVSQFAA
ncbi:MAG: NAD-dependent succinate-semialdehyde dehydrogenase [Betaproteobacteria bacterium]|nr:NAD-dependent succinate-semialdehyde dehydrogenase [Betaproteobacteria bacterium]